MPTLLVFTASPADRAAPQKLAYQEIAGSAGDTERPETGPGVERARIRPLALLSSPPVRVMGLAALCTAHISAIRAHCPANLCSFWGGAAGVPKSILARSEEKSTGKSKFVNSFQLFAPFGSALATRFPFQLFVPARQPGRISRLCRARHNRLYAEYRIMPSKSRRATAGRGFGATCTRHN